MRRAGGGFVGVVRLCELGERMEESKVEEGPAWDLCWNGFPCERGEEGEGWEGSESSGGGKEVGVEEESVGLCVRERDWGEKRNPPRSTERE